MARIGSDKTKVTVRLYDGDAERLQRFYPTTAYSEVIRELVRQHLTRLEDRLSAKLSKFNLPDPEEKR